MFILVAYDVPAKRTVVFHKILACYLMRMQFSVFAGDLKQSEQQRMMGDIDDVLTEDDRVIFISAKNRRNIDISVVEKGQSTDFEAHKSGLIL